MSPDQASIIANEVRYLTQRFDEHAERTEENFAEVKRKQDATNGRLGELEAWRERVKGALAVAASGKSLLVGMVCAVVGALAGHFL